MNHLLSIQFTDPKFNAGATTHALMEVNVRNFSRTSHQVSLTRLIFDDSSTTAPTGLTAGGPGQTMIGSTENGIFTAVPEPTGLALLALGAGGVLTRRRRKQAD